MAIKEIRKIGDPVLRKVAEEVQVIDDELIKIVNDMIDTVQDEKFAAVGLAAPQIGISKRIIVLNYDGIEVLINPKLEVIGDEPFEEEEGCLSIFSVPCSVKRAKNVRLKANDLNGKEIVIDASEMLAKILQHEIDHLNGVLFIDYLPKDVKRDLMLKISKFQ
jgi:peptide deformylase